ncbi:uncharacterized protein LOC144100073 [Amblyomma americanum]
MLLSNLIPDQFDSNISEMNSVCQGAIKMGFPGSVGNCLKDTLKLCSNGTVVDVTFLESLLPAGECILNYLLTTAPITVLRTIGCDMSRSAATVFGPRNVITEVLSKTCSE